MNHADDHHGQRQRESAKFGDEMNELPRNLARQIGSPAGGCRAGPHGNQVADGKGYGCQGYRRPRSRSGGKAQKLVEDPRFRRHRTSPRSEGTSIVVRALADDRESSLSRGTVFREFGGFSRCCPAAVPQVSWMYRFGWSTPAVTAMRAASGSPSG